MLKHLEFTGEVPAENFLVGVEGIEVELIDAPSQEEIDRIIYALNEAPYYYPDARRILLPAKKVREYAKDIMDGKAGFIGNFMEGISFTFGMNNVSRSFTHEMVRHRVGHCYVQQGGRNNDFRHNPIRIPESLDTPAWRSNLMVYKENYCNAVDNFGVTIQDARMMLPIGICTHIIWMCNLRSLDAFCRQRMCNTFHWEMNYVAKLVKVTVMKALPEIGKYLAPTCEHIGKCTYRDDFFEPCGKFPPIGLPTRDGGDREYKYFKEQSYWRCPEEYIQLSGVDERELIKERDERREKI